MSSLHIESNTGLVGGGRLPRPGEVTLSHGGVLFLDELPEFGHTVIPVKLFDSVDCHSSESPVTPNG